MSLPPSPYRQPSKPLNPDLRAAEISDFAPDIIEPPLALTFGERGCVINALNEYYIDPASNYTACIWREVPHAMSAEKATVLSAIASTIIKNRKPE